MHPVRHVTIVCSLLIPMVTSFSAAQSSPLVYPEAHRGDQVDDYHGTKVADPYRWLEDTDSAETHAWVEAENKLTFSYLDQIPYRQAIHERLTKLWNYERFAVPHQEGGRYFFRAQQRTAKPERASRSRIAPRRTARAARPQHALGGWHGRAGGQGYFRRWQADGLWHCHFRFGLERVARARRRHRQRSRRRSQVGEVFQRFLEQGRQGILLQPLRRAQRRGLT